MKFRSRKFILTFLSLTISAIGLFLGKLDGGNFAQIVSVIVASYSFANAAEVFRKKDE